MDIDVVWNNIIKNEGEMFYTKRDKIQFRYTVNGDRIHPRPANDSKIYPITKDTIKEVITNYMPLRTVSQLQQKFFAPSYIYAILTDPRIVLSITAS